MTKVRHYLKKLKIKNITDAHSMKLIKVATIEITPTSPFNFDATFHKPDHFTSGDNYWEPGTRWQTWLYGRKPKQETIDSLIKEIRFRYNLDLDLTDFYKSFKNDKVLAPIIKKWHGMRPGHPSSLYEYLIIGIVLQNATVKRSVQMFRALLENYGTKL